MRSTLRFSALCALLHYVAPSLCLDRETIYGPSDPSRYMFYDAADQCKSTSEPCITNFKYCSNLKADNGTDLACPDGAKLDRSSSWIDLEGSQVFWWAETSDGPIPLFDTTRFARSTYTLKWANTNPKFNTTVFLIPEPGALYGDFGMYAEADFRLQTVVPAGETEYEFVFHDMLESMESSQTGFTNSSFQDHNLLRQVRYSMVSAWNVAFAIGQPDDPQYRKGDRVWLGDGNVTAQSSSFRWSTPIVRDLVSIKEDDDKAKEKALKKKQDKWQLGVGLGVGLGIPVLAAVMFFLGTLFEKKRTQKSSPNINLVDVPKAPHED